MITKHSQKYDYYSRRQRLKLSHKSIKIMKIKIHEKKWRKQWDPYIKEKWITIRTEINRLIK